MSTVEINILINKVTSRGEHGGSVFSGYEVGGAGNYIDASNLVRAYLRYEITSRNVYVGEVWNISGEVSQYSGTTKAGYQYSYEQINASEAHRLSVCGENFVQYVGKHEEFKGIGITKARQLWKMYQSDIYKIIEDEDTYALEKILTQKTAAMLIEAWKIHGFSEALEWLDRMNVPYEMSQRAIEFYGRDARKYIKEDPYRILGFGAKWKSVDDVAIKQLDIKENDVRRLSGAVEDVLIQSYSKGRKKSTALRKKELRTKVKDKLCRGNKKQAGLLADAALDNTEFSPGVVKHNSLYQHAGAYNMELRISEILNYMSSIGDSNSVSESKILTSIAKFESNHKDELPDGLMKEQREAVIQSVLNNLLVISGGAGTGKTTVLKCVYHVLSELMDVTIMQVALAGRAAKRMHEATDIEASTIASFLRKHEKDDGSGLPDNLCLVIDESSMVDVIHAWRILELLPDSARLIMVGDPKQLPPIGAGLVFHMLAECKSSNVVELKVNKRFKSGSGIYGIATLVRDHIWEPSDKYKGEVSGVTFLQSDINNIAQDVLRVYEELGGDIESNDVKIISSVKWSNQGVNTINQLCQEKYRTNDERVTYYEEQYEMFSSPKYNFKKNDPVIFTRNDYPRELMNGALGRVVEVLDPSLSDKVCTVNFEGDIHDLSLVDLLDVELAYAITCHKAQGSQFSKIIIPVLKNALLDHSLIYTALTRGVEQVVFIGDELDIKKAVESPAVATQRTIALDLFMGDSLSLAS
ncbi:MAG: ATP-dependent RecD-like DNA helicase [Cycloclasticus sp.]|nr:ATP-dependent RecD-like DNA helicase [Cycloclasticus sp.]